MSKPVSSSYSLDARSLAIYRIGISLLFLIDLAGRFGERNVFYGDRGVLPIQLLSDLLPQMRGSLLLFGGGDLFLTCFFALAALAGFCLLAGWRTRWAALACWIAALSIDARNPFALNGGDHLLRLSLFWALFLPIGARFSVDAALDPAPAAHRPRASRTAAGFAFAAQAMAPFFVAGLFKLLDPSWRAGEGVWRALSILDVSKPAGNWIAPHGGLTLPLNYLVMAIELAAPALLLLPLRAPLVKRWALRSLFALLAGFWICLELHLFPWACAVVLLALIPGETWDKFRVRGPIRIRYDRECPFCEKAVKILGEFLLPAGTEITPAQDDARSAKEMERRNSWLVECGGKIYDRYAGFVKMLEASPVFFPFAAAAALRPVAIVGDGVYRWVANHRPLFTRAMRPLPIRRSLYAPPAGADKLVWFLLGAVAYWNAALLFPLPKPLPYTKAMRALYLDQGWRVFVPSSSTGQWYDVVGTTASGKRYDVMLGAPVREGLPENAKGLYPDARWRFFMRHLWNQDSAKPLNASVVSYFCRDSRLRQPEDPLSGVSIYARWLSFDPPSTDPGSFLQYGAACLED